MNAVVPHNPAAVAVSTELLGAFAEVSNISDKKSVPTLSTSGKCFTMILNGEKTVLTRKDEDGDRVPVSVARVYIVGSAPERGRSYYAATYDRDNPTPPDCWSVDSRKPDHSLIDAAPPFEGFTGSCATCPMAIKGSKVLDNGKTGSACQQHKMIAVLPANKVGKMPALRLRLAITSVYDGKVGAHEADGWFSYDAYLAQLRRVGIPHTALVRTKMKFDSDVEYPKLLFAIDTPTPDDIGRELLPIVKGDEVRDLLSGTWTPAGADAVRVEKLIEAKAGPTEAERLAAQEAAAQKAAADEKARKAAEKKAAKEAAEAKKRADEEAAAKAAKAKIVIADDDGDEDDGGSDDETPSKPFKGAVTESGIPADVADLLAEWE